jgi:ribosomal protein S8
MKRRNKMIKIFEEQAIKMAYCTIFSDEEDATRKRIVNEILDSWKHYGFIEGYEKIKNNNEESKGEIK